MALAIILWLVISAVVGIAAQSRGRNAVGWFFVSVLISPIIALLFLLVFPALSRERELQFNDAELRKNIKRSRQRL